MGKKQQDHPVIVTVTNRYVRGNGEEVVTKDDTEIPEVRRFDTDVARIRRGYGLTINMGNYESARVDVQVEVPCYVQDLELADEFASKFAEERIKKEVDSVRGTSSGKKSPF